MLPFGERISCLRHVRPGALDDEAAVSAEDVVELSERRESAKRVR